jgi:hypothetical protein
MELQAFNVQANFLDQALANVPRTEWTPNYIAADIFRGQVKSNLWTAQQYLNSR